MGRRRPTVTEQIAHAELCIRANARAEAEAKANREPDPPDGYRKCYDGWWPEVWFESVAFSRGHSDPPAQVIAAGIMIKLAFTMPSFNDTQRAYYRAAAARALESYLRMAQQCDEYLQLSNNAYAADPAGWRAFKEQALRKDRPK